jgi:hypothetical protein
MPADSVPFTGDHTLLVNREVAGAIDHADGSITAAKLVAKIITNALVSDTAAIAYSKLNLAASIVNADVANAAAIARSKLDFGAGLVNDDIAAAAGIAFSKVGTGVDYDAHASRHVSGGADAIAGALGSAALTQPALWQVGTGTTNGTGDATITFPTAFGSAPKVFLQGVDAAAKGIVLDIVSVSTTQVVVKARQVTAITSGSSGSHTHTAFTTGPSAAYTPTEACVLTSGAGATLYRYAMDPSGASKTCTTSTDGAHTHSVDGPVLAIGFNWLAVNA